LFALFTAMLNSCHRIKTQLLVKGSGRGRTASEYFAIAHQRQNLQPKVDQFQSKGLRLMKISPSTMPVGNVHGAGQNQLDFAELDEEGDWLVADVDETVEEEEPEVTPERVVLYLPSHFTLQQRKEYGLQVLGKMEYELREGQANDSLERLRECLAEKSLKFRKEVRLAKGQKKTTRAWDSVHRVDGQIRQAAAMKSDLKMSGDIVEENRVGQRSSVLPWFWRLDRKTKEYCGNYEKECE